MTDIDAALRRGLRSLRHATAAGNLCVSELEAAAEEIESLWGPDHTIALRDAIKFWRALVQRFDTVQNAARSNRG